MSIGLIGRKVGMTQVFADDGTMVAVSVLAIEPNTVTLIRTPERDGYSAVQVGTGTAKRLSRPRLGQLKGLPRVRDVRGLNPKSFDGRGNFALGIKEHIIFPEINYDKVDQVWGMDVVVCTTAKTDEEARALLGAMNFPFRQ